jgi:hypothetical protein
MGSDGVQIKGAGLRTGLRWISKHYGEPAVEQLIEMFPAELRESARRILPSSWYPIVLLENVYNGLPKVTGRKDRAAIEQLLKELNAWVAEENLTTFYRALLLVMTPDRLFEMFPRLFDTYFRGIQVNTSREAGNRGICTVHGLGTVPYVVPGIIGWLEFAYRKAGGSAKIIEESWRRGIDRASPLVFHIDWA